MRWLELPPVLLLTPLMQASPSSSVRHSLRSTSNGLIETARLPNHPGAAAVGANPERDLARPVGLSVAWRISSSLASALQLDQSGSSGGPRWEDRSPGAVLGLECCRGVCTRA